jgi:hypothetical protein
MLQRFCWPDSKSGTVSLQEWKLVLFKQWAWENVAPAEWGPGSEGKEKCEFTEGDVHALLIPEEVCLGWGVSKRTNISLVLFFTDCSNNFAYDMFQSSKQKAVFDPCAQYRSRRSKPLSDHLDNFNFRPVVLTRPGSNRFLLISCDWREVSSVGIWKCRVTYQWNEWCYTLHVTYYIGWHLPQMWIAAAKVY